MRSGSSQVSDPLGCLPRCQNLKERSFGHQISAFCCCPVDMMRKMDIECDDFGQWSLMTAEGLGVRLCALFPCPQSVC